jgi:menaquinone-specific isochorismate synthase
MMSVVHSRLHFALAQRRLISFTRPVAPLDPLQFLRSAPEHRTYWQSADGESTYAGFGAAAEIVAYGHSRFASIQEQADALFEGALFSSTDAPLPRLFGGFSFHADTDGYRSASGIWSAFPSAYFVLPRCQLSRHGTATWLTVNRYADADEIDAEFDAVEQEFEALAARLRSTHFERPLPHLTALRYPLPREAWRDAVTTATDEMRAGVYEKVVLSRTCDLTFDQAVDPVQVLAHLERRYPNAYRFLIEVLPGHSFFGATPELLASVEGSTLHTAALAGSRRRGVTPAEDDALASELITNSKERHEHAVVVDALREMLTPMVRSLDISASPSLYKLTNIQHLYTPIRAQLGEGARALDVVERLHPTPALGGYPRDEAIDAIKRLETVERGWYASPVGWIDPNGDGTFAVAIRSAVSAGDTARLYAGAGIVTDSDPDREWDETGLKFKPLLDTLGVNGHERAQP